MYHFLGNHAVSSSVLRKIASALLAIFLLLQPLGPVFAEEASSTPSGVPEGGGETESLMQPYVGADGSLDASRHIYNGGRYSDIDQLSGTFNFSVPIVVPPGRNGIEPRLALQYNSQPQYETSVVGQGWNIPIPFIERSNKRGTDKMFTDTYFYSTLSGELATTSTTTYQAKYETGDFVTYEFTGNTWTAKDKLGTIYKFGYTASTRQDHPSDSSTTTKWMLEEMRDRNGNNITYTYYKESGQIYPSTITYTHSSSSADGIFEIEFNRESRSHATSSAVGFPVVTKQRISQIVAKVNGSWVRKYELDYTTPENRTKSLLASVTEYGRADDGSTTTRPAYQFAYQESTQKQWTRDSTWVPPTYFANSLGVSQGALFADANGDGRPDVLKSLLRSGVGYRTVYLNNGTGSSGYAWSTSTQWTYPWGPYFTTDGTVRPFFPADLNADGYDDFIYNGSSTLDAKVYLNTTQGWATSTDWAVPTPFVNDAGATAVRIIDLNGDQLPDIIKADEFGSVKGVFLNNGSGWATSTLWAPPQYFVSSSTDLGVVFAELNGDGLPDMTRSYKDTTPEPDTVVTVAYLNTGSGWATTTEWQHPASTQSMEDGIDKGFRYGDINADSYTDLIRGCSCWTFVSATYLNTNSAWTDISSSWPYPYSVTDLSVHDNGTRFLDLNADMLTDIFMSREGVAEPNERIVDFNVSKPVDLLSQITLPQGGSTTIEYKSSHAYRSSTSSLNNNLPYPILTVATTTERDGFGNVAVTTYSYEGGKMYWNSAYDRRFAGFNVVTKTDPDRNVTKTYFHQASTTESSLGEYQDHVSKIGRAYRIEQYDSASNVYSISINKWDKTDLGNERYFPKLAEKLTLTYDGNSDHRDTLESFSYASGTGNIVEKINWGQVTGTASGTYSDTGSDKYTTSLTYATSSTYNIYALPSQETIIDQSGNKVKESRFYYDSLSLGSVTTGNLTKQEMWLSGSTYIDVEKTYNSYGLVATEKDARDKTTTYTYDTYNLYPATTTNPVSHVVGRQFDYSSGKAKTTVDQNSLVYTTSYDGFDRPVEEKQPDLTTPSTLVTRTAYVYTDTGLPTKVQRTDNLSTATSTDSFVYFDGFGRKIEERVEAEGTNTYAVKDFVYNKLGQVQRETLPYFASSTGYSATTSSALFTSYSYDALGRVLTVANVVGTTTNTYNDWVATTTDPLGNYKSFTKDAYGNLITVLERNANTSYLTNNEYNGNGKLTKITDADGNIRNFTYDGLGRRLTAQDLHDNGDSTFGTWTFTYDASGNISTTTDPKSQIVGYTYDDVNRVLTENFTGGAGTEVSYAYDTCTSGKGKLCSATTTHAISRYEYNALGHASSETKMLNGTLYTTAYTYDRLGNKTNITYPDSGQVEYAYNAAGLLESVRQKENGGSFSDIVSNFEYGPHGMNTVTYYGNGASTTKSYDPSELYRLKTIAFGTPTSTLGVGGGGAELRLLEDALFGSTMEEILVTQSVVTPETGEVATSTTPIISDENITDESIIDESTTTIITDEAVSEPETVSSTTPEVPMETPSKLEASTTALEISGVSLAPISALLEGKDASERARIKGEEIAKIGSMERQSVSFHDATYDIEITHMNPIEKGVEVFVRAWTPQGAQLGFGRDGSVEIERFVFINPPILVEDPKGDIVRTSINPDGEEKIYRFREDLREALLQSLVHTIDVKKQKYTDSRIEIGKIGNTTTTVYPQGNPATTAGDAQVQRLNTDTTWSGARNVATGTSASSNDTTIYITAELRTSGKYEVTRGFYNFDTSSIGGGQVVDSAVFSIAYAGDSNGTDPHGLISTSPASNTSATIADYSALTLNSPSEGATRVSSFGTGYHNWSMNGTGVAWVQKTGVTNLGIRMAADIDNSTPSARSYRSWYAADQTGTANDPKLVVEHSVLPPSPIQGYVLRYTYDGVGNITQLVNATRNLTAATTTYSYDNLYRLVTASTTLASSTSYKHSFAYSALGNITAISTTSGATTTYTYAETGYTNPHAPTQIGGATLTYDNNGNVITNGNITYTWDYRNRMNTTAQSGATTTYYYDHTYERVKKVVGATTTMYMNDWYSKEGATTTRFIYGNGELLATVEGNGVSTSTRYYHSDHLGSTRLVSNQSGVGVQAMDYFPYGNPRIDNGPYDADRTFIGEMYDSETNLNYLNWRYLESNRGQFLSQDPVFWEVGQTQDGNTALTNPQLQNSYSYAGNNPIVNKDPSGRFFSLPVLAYFAVDSGAVLLQVYGIGQIVKHTAEFFLSEDKTRPAGNLAFEFAGEAATYFMTPIGRVMFDTTNLAIDLIDDAYGDTIRSGVNRLRSRDNSQPTSQPAPNTNQPLPPSAPASSRPAVPTPQSPTAAPATNSKTNTPAKTSSYDTSYKALQSASAALKNGDYSAAKKHLQQASKSLNKK